MRMHLNKNKKEGLHACQFDMQSYCTAELLSYISKWDWTIDAKDGHLKFGIQS